MKRRQIIKSTAGFIGTSVAMTSTTAASGNEIPTKRLLPDVQIYNDDDRAHTFDLQLTAPKGPNDDEVVFEHSTTVPSKDKVDIERALVNAEISRAVIDVREGGSVETRTETAAHSPHRYGLHVDIGSDGKVNAGEIHVDPAPMGRN